jgi:hypothetical protein
MKKLDITDAAICWSVGFVFAMVAFSGCATTLPGQPTTAQKIAADLARVEPILKDIGAGVKDLGPCSLEIVETVAQALSGSPGWAATLIDDYACITQGVAQLRLDIAANKAPTPSPEHLQAVQSVIAVAAVVQARPTTGVGAMKPAAKP